MEELISVVTSTLVEVIVTLVGVGALVLTNKARKYLDELKKKDELGIIDVITERAVSYAEAEMKGEAGIRKRNFALRKALKSLEDRGITVSEDDVLAGIENGVRKLNEVKPNVLGK